MQGDETQFRSPLGMRHIFSVNMKYIGRTVQEEFPNRHIDTQLHKRAKRNNIKDDNVKIQSEPHVKALGIYIDRKLTFNEHIRQSCTKAARQLNALARISKFLNFKSKKLIFQSFILSNFTYCPLVWHFCGKVNNMKLEKIQERALRIVCNDYTSTYPELIEKLSTTTMVHSRLNCILLLTFSRLFHDLSLKI